MHKAHVHLMFSDGVALAEHDTSGLLEGTGKRARRIKLRDPERLEHPGVRVLLREAAKRTRAGDPRPGAASAGGAHPPTDGVRPEV